MNGDKGWLGILVAIVAVVAVVTMVLVPLVESGVVTTSVGAATNYLEDRGYVVFSAEEFDLLAKEATAAAAVANAEAAVVTAQTAADKVDLYNSAEVYLFPATSDITCTLTAGATNVWSAWTEVTDSGATTLTSKFASDPGFISDIHAFLPSAASAGYNLELAYGDDKDTLGRIAFWVPASGDIGYILPIKSRRVPAGETVYYRLQSTGAGGSTVQVRIRYFYE